MPLEYRARIVSAPSGVHSGLHINHAGQKPQGQGLLLVHACRPLTGGKGRAASPVFS